MLFLSCSPTFGPRLTQNLPARLPPPHPAHKALGCPAFGPWQHLTYCCGCDIHLNFWLTFAHKDRKCVNVSRAPQTSVDRQRLSPSPQETTGSVQPHPYARLPKADCTHVSSQPLPVVGLRRAPCLSFRDCLWCGWTGTELQPGRLSFLPSERPCSPSGGRAAPL